METLHVTKKKLYSAKFLKKRAARIMIVQVLYLKNIKEIDSPPIEELVLDIIAISKKKADSSYLLQLVKFIQDNHENINLLIEKNINTDWRLDRLPKVVLAILQSGIGELLCYKTLDKEIIINEYLEIAKTFNHGGEAGFVNAVLDKASLDR